MTEPRQTHTREQREAWATDVAHETATFYQTLRKRKVPAAAAQAITESFITALLGGDGPPEPWQS